MRPKINPQDEFEFQPSNLKLTNDYYAKYEAISALLDENPKIMDTTATFCGASSASSTDP